MKQHKKSLTLNKETLTNLQESTIKGGFVASWDYPCRTTAFRCTLPDVSNHCTDTCRAC